VSSGQIASLDIALAAIDAALRGADPKNDPRFQCARNMKMLGLEMATYAKSHQQHYPDDLGALMASSPFSVKVVLCPENSAAAPPDTTKMTAAERAAWVNEHTDYVYMGKGLTTDAPADRIIMYDKSSAHGGDGMHMLYADGHVGYEKADDAKRILDAIEKRGEEGL